MIRRDFLRLCAYAAPIALIVPDVGRVMEPQTYRRTTPDEIAALNAHYAKYGETRWTGFMVPTNNLWNYDHSKAWYRICCA